MVLPRLSIDANTDSLSVLEKHGNINSRSMILPSFKLWLLTLALWAFLLNIAGFFTQYLGPLIILSLLLVVALLLRLRAASLPNLKAFRGRDNLLTPTNLLLVFLLSLLVFFTTIEIIKGFTLRPNWLMDISKNTYAACETFASGGNPYSTKTQLWHQITPDTPNAEVQDDHVRMFGVPYYYGYPYFPVMFLSYMPFYYLIDGYSCIRAFNILLLVLNIIGIVILTSKLSKFRIGLQTLIGGIIAYLCVLVYPRQIFSCGIVDILISTYALYAFVALAYQKYWFSGILLGLAQASKLLPGPLLVIPVLLILLGKQGAWKVLTGYILVSILFILPFWAWNPDGFLSATVLYYLSYHAGGDYTSLWFFLPDAIKSPFLLTGVILTLVVMILVARPKRGDLLDAITATFSCYVIFIAFSKMAHLNYLWAVYPLGCVSFSVLSARLIDYQEQRTFRIKRGMKRG